MAVSAHSLRLAEVAFYRGTQRLSFELTLNGAITTIAGASGSGKTTLLHLIAGFETPAAGHILLDGADVTSLHPSERPVSLVFQDNNLFAHLDIATNVGLGISPSLSLTDQDRAAISEALTRTGLAGYEKRLPESLSGGERQRAAFARALVRKRPFLLLDEPFAALDPELRRSMGALLKELQWETGIMVLLVTHLPDEVERLSDDVVFIEKGEVIFAGPRSDIQGPQAPEPLRAFLGNRAQPA